MIIKNERNEYIEFNVKQYYEDSNEYLINIKAKSAFITVDFNITIFATMFEELYDQLSMCYKKLKGSFRLKKFNLEENLELEFTFTLYGHVRVKAYFISNDHFGNECKIEFQTDQTYIHAFLDEFKTTID